MAERLKVTLNWIQILDSMEPFYKERGEFRFKARVKGDDRTLETSFPTEGYYEISDHPAWNKLNLEKVIFEGEVGQRLVVELMGEEIDFLSANDKLDHYKREFAGNPAAWIGEYNPGEDETSTDPENMSNWRVAYSIGRA